MTRPALALTAAALVAVPAPGRPDALAELEHEHARLFDRVAPAVVAISNGSAIGAGFAVAPELVVTAAHVVLGATDVEVTLRDRRVVRGQVIERSPGGLDLALLRVPVTPSAVLALSASPAVRAGSIAAAVGHGDGNRWSLATGIVSSAEVDGANGPLFRLQIPLRPGASGGPVVDREGRVIGVVTHGAAGAVSFAVRSDVVLRAFAGLAGAEQLLFAAAEQGRERLEEEDAVEPPAAPALVFGPADPRPWEAHEPTVVRPQRKSPARHVAARRSPTVLAATRLEPAHGPGPHPEEIALMSANRTRRSTDGGVWTTAGAIVGVVFAGIVIASAIARRRFRPKVVPGEGVADGLRGRGPRLRVVRGSDR